MAGISNLFDPLAHVGIESAVHAVAVVPHDTNTLAVPPAFLWVGGAGTIAMDLVGGETVAITVPLEALGPIPFRPTLVYDTGTTATGIVACW